MKINTEAAVDFVHTSSDELLEYLLLMPSDLRPTSYNIGEDEPRIPLKNDSKTPKALLGRQSGYFLYGPGFFYDVSFGARGAITLSCDFESSHELVENLLIQLAPLRPVYGFAAAPEERVARNRVYHRFGINKLEAWVGRESGKWLPGLYWINLLSEELAARHGVPLEELASISRRHWELGNGLHLFRLYDHPSDWTSSNLYPRFLKTIPGLFDIEVVKQRLPAAKNFLEVQDVLSKW